MSATAPAATPNIETRRVMREMLGRQVLVTADGGYRIHNARDKHRVSTRIVDGAIAVGWALKDSDGYVVLTDAGRDALALADGARVTTTSTAIKGK